MGNIKYQFLQAIENSFKENMDKHSIKKTEGHTDKIFSYAARKNIINTASEFSKFLNNNYTGDEKIRYVKEIGVQHINSYLLSKKDSCTQETINQISSQLNKLELVCNKKYHLKLDWHTFRTVPQNDKKSIRNVAFTDKQVKQIKDFLLGAKECYGKKAIYIGMRWGLRAQEIECLKVKDFSLDKMQLRIAGSGAKGGRVRTLEIKKEDIPLIKYLTNGKGTNDRVIPIRKNSICNYLHNVCVKLGFKDILDNKTSFHALRKYRAIKYYNELISKGIDKNTAQGIVCEFLGHSRNRVDIARHYLLLNRRD